MLPTHSVQAIYKLNLSCLKQVANKTILVVDNKPAPIKILSHLLGIDHLPLDMNETYFGLSINFHTKNFILLIDNILDERPCVVKALPFPYTKLEQYIGVTLTGESELVLVLDPLKLMQMALSDNASWLNLKHIASPHLEKKIVSRKRVLVVDDSLTSRILCSNAIEMAGYEAVSMTNGKKAWDILQQEKFDCVITDILMPEMDGFELTKLIKNDKKHSHIPVIVVSSLDSKKDKLKGLEVGADAFIVKNEFDTHKLIEMMESLI